MTEFDHVKTVLGIVLGLSVTHLIKGVVKFVQHPKAGRPYWIHLSWCIYMLLLITHFWWWEAQLRLIKEWNFAEYFFLVCYITVYYSICALLIPENIMDYKGFRDYFYSRKKWIFGALGLSFLMDFVDTFIKGSDYYHQHYNWEYPVRNITHIILCLIAMKTSNVRFHAWLVAVFLIYELSYIYRLFLYY